MDGWMIGWMEEENSEIGSSPIIHPSTPPPIHLFLAGDL
jgi:hypothetical protein